MRHRITRHDYQRYRARAYQILNQVAAACHRDLSDLSYSHIISYFEDSYPIIFNFYDFDSFGALYPELEPPIPSTRDIKYKTLVKKQRFSYQSQYLCENCSGMTYPDLEKNRYVVSVNQHQATKGRVIFTILHELSHIFCHLGHNQAIYLSLATVKMVGNYPPHLLALEQEADTVASILYLPDERLMQDFDHRKSFWTIQQETNISKTALHNRLMNYLIHNLNYTEKQALNLVLDYRNGGEMIFHAKLVR